MERVCLAKRIGFVVFFVGVARLTWALSDVFNLPAEDGCVGSPFSFQRIVLAREVSGEQVAKSLSHLRSSI